MKINTRLFVLPVALIFLAALAGRAAPQDAAAAEPAKRARLETATFSMYCYWTGEATVGEVPGVVASRIGHLDGQEVVEVTYDPALTDVGELTRTLRRRSSFYSLIVSTSDERAAAERHLDASDVVRRRGEPHFIESKHSLRVRYPALYYLDLSEAQAIALNTWSHFGGPMPDVLTAEQQRRWQRLRDKLARDKPRGLDPDGARSGKALDAYREALQSWLEK